MFIRAETNKKVSKNTELSVDHRVFKVFPTQSVSEYCFVSFSVPSWQCHNRRKPEVGIMPYLSSASVSQMPLYDVSVITFFSNQQL